jgi:filamentous hemagglutinin family protein
MNRLRNTIISSDTLNKAKGKLLATTMLTAAGLLSLMAPAKAMDDFTTPQGENVVGGSATFDRPELGTLNINQSTNRVVINWNHFNIGAKGKTEFFQPGKGSLAVNRVTGGSADPTKILGSLKANGNVMVIDTNGVFFGQDSVVDVGGIIASTGNVGDADIMDGDGQFEFNNFGAGKIELNGTMNIAEAGLAAFVSPFVSNNGVINAKLGKVAMAGGHKVTLDLYGDNLVEIAVSDAAADALLENAGTINAEGGQVLMTAQAAKAAVDDVINMSGVVDVSSVEVKGGKIVLSGGKKGAVSVSGELKAAGTTGGSVNVTGQNVYVADTAVTNVSGGAGSDGVGNAGEAYFIADGHTDFRGTILGRGGVNGGDGAFAEVSGYDVLGYSGYADLFAANGKLGTLLLDPTFAVIHSGLVNNPLGFNFILAAWALANSMENANVVVQADNFIDVGTQNDSYNTGNGTLDLALNTLVGTGDIDLSTYNYSKLEITGYKSIKTIFGTQPTDRSHLIPKSSMSTKT